MSFRSMLHLPTLHHSAPKVIRNLYENRPFAFAQHPVCKSNTEQLGTFTTLTALWARENVTS
jgi:hypothetical protein